MVVNKIDKEVSKTFNRSISFLYFKLFDQPFKINKRLFDKKDDNSVN